MTDQRRQLAAIMFTDIVGYTALMGKDSAKAMELVRKSKEIQKPLVEKYQGRWIKEMGDGILAQFNTALDAVRCALEIQRISRADFEADLRIGIHLGDITIENEDVYGDGVNVASRLESVADPGGIYISESIEKAIRGQSEIRTIYLGESQLKNVDYGVRTYAVQGTGLPIPKVDNNKNLTGRFWAEVHRRDVIRAGMAYLVVSFLVVLLVSYLRSWIIFPDWIITAVIFILAIFLPVALYLAWNYEFSPNGLVRTTSKDSWRNPLKSGQRKPFTSNVIIIGLLAMVLLIYFYPHASEKGNVPSKVDSSLTLTKKSIAVLPFKNLSGSEDNLYFSDGVMEAILNNLSRIRDLKVVSRTSVEKYRKQNKSIKEIAQELEVANILEGSVQRIGDEVRITAQLISADDDEHIWADNYDRQLTDIFSIQSEIAQKIAENLEVIMTSEERELIKNAPTSNLKAYELFLKVRHHQASSEEEIEEDIALYDEAIDLDPDFGLAYAFKGDLLSNLSYYGYPKSIWFDSVMVLQDLAIQKDPEAWEPYMIMALEYETVHEDDQALKNLRKVIELNPNFDYAYQLLGRYSMRDKDYEKAIDYLLKSASLVGSEDEQSDIYEHYGYFLYDLDIQQSYQNFKKSYENNPENIEILRQLRNCANYFQEYDKALEFSIEYQKHRPDLLNAKNLVAESYLTLKRYDQAEKYYQEMRSEFKEFKNDYMIYPFMHRLGYAKMMNGKEKEGIKIMEIYRDTLLANISRQEIKTYSFAEYYDLAIIYAALDNKAEAYHWLNKARKNENAGAFYRLDYLISDPMLDNLRGDPEFQEMLQEKLDEREKVKNIFYNKLAIYHANNELKWLSSK